MIEGRIVAGLGFRAQCSAEELAALLRRAEQALGVVVTGLATPHFKSGAPELVRAAAELGLSIVSVAPQALAAAQISCLTRSTAALAAVGVASIAEACALAAAGPGARLLAPRMASSSATCALAQGNLS